MAEKLVRHTFYKWKPKAELDVISSEDIPLVEETIIDYIFDDNEETLKDNIKKIDITATNTNIQFTKSEAYNGNIFENYCWSQTIIDIDIAIQVPENISAKNISVEISPSNIKIHSKNGIILLEGELCKKCKAKDAIWSIDKNKLHIHLEKCQEIWWNCLIKSEPQLDISKIDCSRPYDELSEEAQAKIEELQWNQERKKLGLPTSDELTMHSTLKKAWNAKGSPFTGPFDPSIVTLN